MAGPKKTNLLNFLYDRQSQKEVVGNLLDVSNRGAVAGTFGAPVDMATNLTNLLIAGGGYAGHKMGLLGAPPDLIEPRNVPLSSEWIGQKMQNAGLVSEYRNPVAEALAAIAIPMAMQKGAGALGRQLQHAEQVAATQPKMRAQSQRGVVTAASEKRPLLYHGTKDEFEGLPSKKYGGVYFAEDPSVAEMYSGNYGSVKTANISPKAKIFDATKQGSEKLLKKIEREYDNATDYKDPDDGSYMPLSEWVKTGYLFKLGRKAQDEVMESIKAEGFDIVRYKDASPMTGDSISWVVLDNSKINTNNK